MRLRTRFRLNVGISLTTLAALGLVLAWAMRESLGAMAARDAAIDVPGLLLQQEAVGTEYLVAGEERARSQWRELCARLDARIGRARQLFAGTPEEDTLTAMSEAAELNTVLFQEAAELRAKSELGEPVSSTVAAAADRLKMRLAIETQDLGGRSIQLIRAATRREARTQRLAIELGLALVLAALAVALANAVLAERLVARRLRLLRLSAKQVASGDLSHRAALAGNDELAELGAHFDEMADRLQHEVRQLETSNRELEAFSYSVSHDLRAPLRHVAGFVTLLRERLADAMDAESRRYLGLVTDATARMGRLIDDLLGFSRAGRAALVRSRVRLATLVPAVIEELSDETSGRKVEWDLSQLPEVDGDPSMLRQVFANLLSNALKFTRGRPSACIAIGSTTRLDEVHVFVRDNGVGFDMRYAGKLFGVFQRLHRPEDFEGNGIGLANVQRVVQRHGGRVWAESEPDRGATFWFSLPWRGARECTTP